MGATPSLHVSANPVYRWWCSLQRQLSQPVLDLAHVAIVLHAVYSLFGATRGGNEGGFVARNWILEAWPHQAHSFSSAFIVQGWRSHASTSHHRQVVGMYSVQRRQL